MKRAKDCMRSSSLWVVTGLGLGLSLVDMGCSGVSGLRSVGTERPSFLAMWDRRSTPGSPSPDNDAYAKNMRAGRARADAIAQKSSSPTSPRDDDAADRADQLADGRNPSDLTHDKSSDSAAPKETIRVSLGRPEPLPGLNRANGAPEMLVSTRSTPTWKSETKELTDPEPSSRKPAEPRESSGLALSRPADRGRPSVRAAIPASAADASAEVNSKALLSRAAARLDGLQNYQVKLTRLERVNGQLQPEEDVLLSIQRDPKAIRLEWSGGPNKGREVIYSSKLDPRMIFVHMSNTPIPLPAMRIPVDSPLVMRNSRHAITEAGFDSLVTNLKKSSAHGDDDSEAGTLHYRGPEKPSGLDRSCHHFVRRTQSGETWNVYLDQSSLLPRMVVAEDRQGELIERYVYREIRENPAELKTADAFSPEKRWGDSKSLVGRLTRAASSAALPSTDGPATR
jgi:hypothetical protein